ncbi:RNA polymerase sigma factor [Salininema proteolyticum]|uniref:RNA polymerase sigma factor n=1 Tax=Salininema proteolyticum TaxID=1607685 RepID=A0ABV8TY74_9ACTN
MRTESDFIDLYEAHYSDLAAQVAAYLGDAVEAQDMVQEAFLRAWQRWEKIGGYEQPLAWVRRVAWNLATNRHRRLQVARKFLLKQREPEGVPAANPDHIALRDALQKVGARQRKALVMHYMADMRVAQIAEACGVRVGTVKSWLHRGRKELAEILGDDRESLRRTGAPPDDTHVLAKPVDVGDERGSSPDAGASARGAASGAPDRGEYSAGGPSARAGESKDQGAADAARTQRGGSRR